MQLSKRLETIAACIPQNAIIADIGTDHACLPVYLLQKGVCPRAVAGDLNTGPVELACNTVKSRGLENRIEIRQGDGLKILKPGEVDVVIMAGMGGELMARLLEEGKDRIKTVQRLVLQPNNNAGDVRSWLAENGWGIIDEHLVKERGKFYPVIISEQSRGIFATDPLSLEVGPSLLQKGGPLVKEFLALKSEQYNKILEGLSKSMDPSLSKKKKKITEILQGIKGELKHGC